MSGTRDASEKISIALSNGGDCSVKSSALAVVTNSRHAEDVRSDKSVKRPRWNFDVSFCVSEL